MKYEMIFGDEALFDGAGEFTGIDIVTRNVDDGLYRTSRLSDCTPSTIRKNPIVAMRRIIKVPVWKKADKLAGKLPEVGCKAVQIQGFCEVDVLMIHNGCVVVCNSEISDSRPAVFKIDSFMELFTPLETPAEKAQREEDEFVESTCRQNEPHSTLYSDGVRAAYRKLKGGE